MENCRWNRGIGNVIFAKNDISWLFSIITTALMEANEKAIHNLYLGKYLKNIAFSETDKAEIIAIATQCPIFGGNGVFKA